MAVALPREMQLLHALDTYDSPLEMTALAATYRVRPIALAEFMHDFLSRSFGGQGHAVFADDDAAG